MFSKLSPCERHFMPETIIRPYPVLDSEVIADVVSTHRKFLLDNNLNYFAPLNLDEMYASNFESFTYEVPDCFTNGQSACMKQYKLNKLMIDFVVEYGTGQVYIERIVKNDKCVKILGVRTQGPLKQVPYKVVKALFRRRMIPFCVVFFSKMDTDTIMSFLSAMNMLDMQVLGLNMIKLTVIATVKHFHPNDGLGNRWRNFAVPNPKTKFMYGNVVWSDDEDA